MGSGQNTASFYKTKIGSLKQNLYHSYEASKIYFHFFNGIFSPSHCSFNPLDKVIELYERMLQAEKEKVEYLEKLLKEK